MHRVVAALCAFLALEAADVHAYHASGHEVIEALAYRHLLDPDRPEVLPGVRGEDVIRFLIREQILVEPRCFEPAPGSDDAEECREAYAEDPLRWWPALRSAEPDNVVFRQFGSDGQCFHFMARAEDVVSTEEDPGTGLPVGLYGDAYVRCMRLLDELLVRSLYDSAAANAEMFGAYGLMHAIADSFSAGHVDRDAHNRIVYLKPWRLRTWWTYLTHPGGWQHFFGSSHHAAFLEDDDDDYVVPDREVDGAECEDVDQPYRVAERCFSRNGLRAVRATEDLLVLLYQLRRRQVDGEDALDARTDPLWRRYQERHLRHAPRSPEVPDDGSRPEERNPEPGAMRTILVDRLRSMNFGLAYEREWADEADSLMITERVLPLRPRELSLMGFLSPSFGIGVRRHQDRHALLLAIDLGLWFPLSGDIQVSVVPLSMRGTVRGDEANVSFGLVPVRLDLFLAGWLWLGIEPARFEVWGSGRSTGTLSGITLGVALDARPVATELDSFERIVSTLEQNAVGEPGPRQAPGAQQPPPHDSEWSPPDEPTLDWPDTNEWKLAVSVGGAVFAREGSRVCSALEGSCPRTASAEAQLLHTWGDWNVGILRALGVTLRLDGTFGDDTLLTAGLGPTLRFYLMPDVIAAEATVLAEAGALRAHGTDGPGWERYLDLGTQLSLLLSVRQFELFLDFPRISFLGEERATRIGLAARVGWMF